MFKSISVGTLIGTSFDYHVCLGGVVLDGERRTHTSTFPIPTHECLTGSHRVRTGGSSGQDGETVDT